MRFSKICIPATLAALAIATVGCVDENYDLSDIDTTTQLKVVDLVLPVNIDPIMLGDIITYDDDSKIRPILIDGKEVYALSEEGEFSSDDILVNGFTATSPTLTPTVATLARTYGARSSRATMEFPEFAYKIEDIRNEFSFQAEGLDPAIEAIYSAGVEPLEFEVTLQVTDVAPGTAEVAFTDLEVQMPKGLTIDTSRSDGTYDASTGTWKVGRKEVQSGATSVSIALVATRVDFRAAGGGVNADHQLEYKGEISILSGVLSVRPVLTGGVPTELPETIDLRVDYRLSDIVAKTVSGRVKYDLEGLDIAPVELNDIPDFLAEPGTNVRLANPQIYLQVNNPVGNYGLSYSTGLTLTAYREGVAPQSFSPNSGGFSVDAAHGVDGPYNFVMSPKNSSLVSPSDFAANQEWIEFTTLSGLLATPAGIEGSIPSSIGIALDNPGIPSQEVSDFELGTTLPGVKGRYRIVAPLALEGGSVISYSDRTDGWLGEDSDDEIAVTTLVLTADADNEASAGVTLTAYPLDRDGNDIPGVKITSTVLQPAKTGQKIEIRMEGEAMRVDGVRFVATITGVNGGEPLSPTQAIKLTDIRARVSGYYLTSF